MRSVLDQALDYHARGLNVLEIPLPGGDYDGKTPARRSQWADLQSRRQTPDEIRARFAHPANVAIVTGRISGVVVLDADNVEALRWCVIKLPYTPWQVRTAKGWHLYFKHPGAEIRNRVRIDTGAGKLAMDGRADGGFVLAPPSLHASGVRYQLAGDWSKPIDALPLFDPAWLETPKRRQLTTTCKLPRPTGDVAERARRYLAAVPPPEIGAGSDSQTFRMAARLVRGFNLDPSTAEALIWERFGGRPGWTRGWVASKVRSAERYATEPQGALL